MWCYTLFHIKFMCTLKYNKNTNAYSYMENDIKRFIAVLIFKTLNHKEPTYLSQLLVPYQPTCNLRSSDQHLVIVPNMKSNFGKRSFTFSAPAIWNSLPLALCTCTS